MDAKRREFSAEDLVLQKAVENTQDVKVGKLAPNWEGSYRITAITEAGVYYLEDMDERPLPQP